MRFILDNEEPGGGSRDQVGGSRDHHHHPIIDPVPAVLHHRTVSVSTDPATGAAP